MLACLHYFQNVRRRIFLVRRANYPDLYLVRRAKCLYIVYALCNKAPSDFLVSVPTYLLFILRQRQVCYTNLRQHQVCYTNLRRRSSAHPGSNADGAVLLFVSMTVIIITVVALTSPSSRIK